MHVYHKYHNVRNGTFVLVFPKHTEYHEVFVCLHGIYWYSQGGNTTWYYVVFSWEYAQYHMWYLQVYMCIFPLFCLVFPGIS